MPVNSFFVGGIVLQVLVVVYGIVLRTFTALVIVYWVNLLLPKNIAIFLFLSTSVRAVLR